MSLESISKFNDMFEYIDKTKDDDISKNISKQNRALNSDSINNNFKQIEAQLNKSYERTRVLEDMIKYTKSYIDNEINSTIEECRAILNDIENISDMNFNNIENYTLINVPLLYEKGTETSDRDGSILKQCGIYDGLVTFNADIKNITHFKNITITRNDKHQESNEKELLEGKPYRVSYSLDDSVKGGIEELITVVFDNAEEVNSFNLKLSNCTLENTTYVYEDGTNVVDDAIKPGIMPSKKIISFKILINSKNYKIENSTNDVNTKNRFDELI